MLPLHSLLILVPSMDGKEFMANLNLSMSQRLPKPDLSFGMCKRIVSKSMFSGAPAQTLWEHHHKLASAGT